MLWVMGRWAFVPAGEPAGDWAGSATSPPPPAPLSSSPEAPVEHWLGWSQMKEPFWKSRFPEEKFQHSTERNKEKKKEKPNKEKWVCVHWSQWKEQLDFVGLAPPQRRHSLEMFISCSGKTVGSCLLTFKHSFLSALSGMSSFIYLDLKSKLKSTQHSNIFPIALGELKSVSTWLNSMQTDKIPQSLHIAFNPTPSLIFSFITICR